MKLLKKAAITLALVFALFAGLFVTLPVMADPTNGQKVPVRITWSQVGKAVFGDILYSDGLSHRPITREWTVAIYIDGATTPSVTGTAHSEGLVLWAYTKLEMANYNDYFELSFPNGGFEGNAHFLLTNYDATTKTYDIRINALFQGTGIYDGQTLNVGRDKGPGSYEWFGYLLKR